MLTDPKEIEIISRARQANVRDPNRSRDHFVNIFEDFLHARSFEGSRLLDLGPGQFDFGELARERGAAIVVGIDNDPAVIELGRHKGFEVEEMQLKSLVAEDRAPYDGVFCKFSINAFWFGADADSLRAYVGKIGKLVTQDGWAWIAPWNGVPKNGSIGEGEVAEILRAQAEAFRDEGFEAFELDADSTRRYGVSGRVANHALFIRNLPVPATLTAHRAP